ncbi:50S ribosomal protein L19 [candidate division WWE3 bacterium]|uniref:Large ribosomal subunit protein bL19 n=1 Tax=candidate division WWE3 bacterium TaxID=2053526 RepID=A0A7X9HGG3_UNCKA|nr:50S ribosomal protein L19 [candidate division WWE3 bacterium]
MAEKEVKLITSDPSTYPDFRAGDTVRVHYKIIEGDKARIQPYEGIVLSRKGSGTSKSFTVRRIGADNVAVERIFPLFSPNIEKIELVKTGDVRRAKLYYLREKKGREAMRIKEGKVKVSSTKEVVAEESTATTEETGQE